MADAPGHLLGQIIGNTLEDSLEPLLRQVAVENGLYLDKKGSRAARTGLKCTWTDGLGNAHDLDFVLERAGNENHRGTPAAFIETAWRRYTKHSRAKAQEIQGALLPLLQHHSAAKPFAGAVVAGQWTSGALQQMRSSGFEVLHVSYEDIVAAFAAVGVDVDADEGTSDEYLKGQIDLYRALPQEQHDKVASSLISIASDEYLRFTEALEGSLRRKIVRIVVLPLSGALMEFTSLHDAIQAIEAYEPHAGRSAPFVRFEVQMTYSNGDEILGKFSQKDEAIAYIRTYIT